MKLIQTYSYVKSTQPVPKFKYMYKVYDLFKYLERSFIHIKSFNESVGNGLLKPNKRNQ